MNDEGVSPFDWSGLDRLTDSELRVLVDTAVSILSENTDQQSSVSLAELPPRALISQLQDALAGEALDTSVASRIGNDETLARSLVIAVMGHLSSQPELAAEIAQAYEARRNLMIVDPATLLAAALVLVALKVKRVQIGRVTIDFYPARAGIVSAIRQLFGG